MTNPFQNILLLHPDEIEGDISIAESAYILLSTVSLDKSLFIGELDDDFLLNQIQILKVWQTVLRVKGEQAEVAMKEFLCKARESDSQIFALAQKFMNLEKELIRKQKQIDEFHSIRNSRDLHQEDTPILVDIKYKNLTVEMESCQAQLIVERKTNQHLNSELQIQKVEFNKLREELKLVELECCNYKEQLQEIKAGMVIRRINKEHIKERVNSLVQENSEFSDIDSNLRNNCKDLKNENKLLKLQFQQAISDLDSMANLNKALEYRQSESVRVLEKINMEKDNLQDQLKDIKLQLSMGIECDIGIFEVVDNKVEEWNLLLIEKESLLRSALQRVETLQLELDNNTVLGGLNQSDNLHVSLREKDTRINVLEQQLYTAMQDFEKVSTMKRDEIIFSLSSKVSSQNLRGMLKQDVVDQIESERELRLRAENSASNKDELYAKTLTELKKLESGDFGLHEALSEIKNCKKQIFLRDEDIARLTSQVNDLDSQFSQILEENAALKFNSGIEYVDLVPLRDVRELRIHDLTLERDMLAKMIGTFESDVVDQKGKLCLLSHRDIDVIPLIKDLEENREFENSKSDNIEQVIDDLSSQLHCLQSISYGQKSSIFRHLNIYVQKIIALLETRICTNDDENTIKSLRPQVSQLQEQLSTLSDELNYIRNQQDIGQLFGGVANTNSIEFCGEQTETGVYFGEVNQGVNFSLDVLPPRLDMFLRHLNSILYDHLLQVFATKGSLENRINMMLSEMVNYERRLSTIICQQGFIYRDYINKPEVGNTGKKDWINVEARSILQNEKYQILVEEIFQLKRSLSEYPNELKTRFIDLLSKFSVLRHTEQKLHRKYFIQKLNETGLKNEIFRLRAEMESMESTITERISYLIRFKDAALYKIALLQSEVEESVSLNEHAQLNREYSALCRKYELTLGCETTYYISEGGWNCLESENAKLLLHIDQLQKDFIIYRENKSALTEGSNDDRLGLKFSCFVIEIQRLVMDTKSGWDSVISPFNLQHQTKKLPSQTGTNSFKDDYKVDHLESLLLNETQRAELYQLRFEQSKKMLTTLENRNVELEQNYTALTEKYLSSQEAEQNLRDELLQSLTFEDAEEQKMYIRDLVDNCAYLTNECEKLKSIADISKKQSDSLLHLINANDNELSAMKMQLINLQAESNQNLIIGKLHLEITHLQISEGISYQRLSKAKNHEQFLESKLLQLQKILQHRENSNYLHKTELVKKIQKLQTYNQFLKRKLSISTPLISKEKLATSINQLKVKKDEANTLVKELRQVKYQTELKEAEYELKIQQIQELLQDLSDSKSLKIRDIHNKLGDYQLNELRLNRKLARFEFQLCEEKRLSKMNEQSIIILEEELALVVKEKETIQIESEQQESELENIMEDIEKSKQRHFLPELELLFDALPDPTAPLNEQLDHSVHSLGKFGSLLVNLKEEKERFEKELHESLSHSHKVEDDLLIKEREVTELKLRIPEYYLGSTQVEPERLFEFDNQLKLAQNTIHSMQIHLTQREGTIEKYQEKLQDARAESEKLFESYRQEVENLSSKLCTQSDSTIQRLEEAAKDAVSTTTQSTVPQDHLFKLKEMEELIQELEREKEIMINENTNVKSLLKIARDEKIRTKQVCHDEAYMNIAEYTIEITKLTEMNHQIEHKLVEKELKIEVLEGEISTTKEASKEPLSRIMKDQVNRLKQEVTQKDQDINTLKDALLQVKSELMDNAEHTVRQEARGAGHKHSLHVIINERTSDYQEKLKKAYLKNEQFNKQLAKKEEETLELKEEISKLKRMLNKQFAHSVPVRETDNNDNKMLEKELEQERITMNTNISDLNNTRDLLKQENNELKGPNNTLEKENEQLKLYIMELETFKCKQIKLESKGTLQISEVSKWEEGKKWQKKVETQKLRYNDKVRDFENAQKQIQLLKSLLEKSDRDKSILQNKIKQVGKHSMFPPIEDIEHKEIEELKSKLFAVQNEKNILERKLVLDRDIKLQELQNINDTLKFRLEALDFKTECPKETKFEQDNSLQNNLLECQKENIRLNFDFEKSQKEISSLIGRIDELESFNKNLKTENDSLRNETERNEKPNSGANKCVPLTKQVSDLEKVVTSMKRVIENMLKENNSLKKQIHTKDLPKLSELQKENRNLKTEAEECKEENRKNFAKKEVEIDQVRKQTSKKADKVEKQLNIEVESVNSKLKVKEKQYSDTLKELNKKSIILLEVKKHLKIAADRESEIIREKEVLQEQIKFFENLTSGNQGLKKLGEKFQQARREILDFENERESLVKNNAEIKREIKGLKEVRLLDNEITNTAELQSLIAENERLLNEVAQLKRELNALDPIFFEEIEDLKFNYKESVQKNLIYQEHIAMLITEYGIPPPEF